MSETTTVKSITAYNLIRELILTGELLPGTRLVLAELEEKLGVGRGPIREALMRLDKSGLVQNIPYKGALVTPPPSFKEMESIYQTRILVERTLALESMRLATPEDLADLERIAASMADSCDDETLFFHKDRQFHCKLYSISRMHHMMILMDRLMDHVEIFLMTRRYERQDKDVILEQHAAILRGMVEKDETLLCASLEKNILIGLDLVQKEMDRFSHRGH